MSHQGCVAVETEMNIFLLLLDKMKSENISPEDQLQKIREHVNETLQAAKSGWL